MSVSREEGDNIFMFKLVMVIGAVYCITVGITLTAHFLSFPVTQPSVDHCDQVCERFDAVCTQIVVGPDEDFSCVCGLYED